MIKVILLVELGIGDSDNIVTFYFFAFFATNTAIKNPADTQSLTWETKDCAETCMEKGSFSTDKTQQYHNYYCEKPTKNSYKYEGVSTSLFDICDAF